MSGSDATTRLILVRHGRVAAEWTGRVYGDLDVPLGPEGEADSRRVAALLSTVRFDAVVSSGLARTEHLAALLRAASGLPRRDERDLREIGRGDWCGLRPDEVPDDGFRRWTRAPAAARAPGGESLADLAARALPRLAALAREHAGGTVAVVTHSWVARVAAAHALGLELDRVPRLVLSTGAILVLDWSAGGAAGGALELSPPVLAGFAIDALPGTGRAWFRGPGPPAAPGPAASAAGR